jgi:hypothetical protein
VQALLVASSLVCCANGAQYTLRMLPDDKAKATNAVCLDGTNPGYYIRPGACVRAQLFAHMNIGWSLLHALVASGPITSKVSSSHSLSLPRCMRLRCSFHISGKVAVIVWYWFELWGVVMVFQDQ